MANKIIKCIKIILPIVIILIMAYAIGGQIYLSDERTEDMSFCESLDTKWYRVWEDGRREEIELPSSVKIENSDVDVVETVLYDKIDRGACLCVISSKQDVNIYIDGELRETYSTKDTRLFGKTSVGRYLFVELDQNDAGKVLRIEMSSDSKYLGTVKQVYYGDKLGIWIDFIKENVAAIIIPFLTLFVALVAVIVASIYNFRTRKNVSSFYYAVAVMLISMWILSISSVRQLIYNNVTAVHDISIILATLYLVPLALYFDGLQKGRYKMMYGLYASAVLIYNVVINVFVVTNRVDTSETVIFNEAMVAIGMVLLVITLCLDFKKKKLREYRDVATGFMILCLAGVVQMAAYFVITTPYEGNAIAIGILITLIISIYHSVKEVKKVSEEKEYLEETVSVKENKIQKLTYQALETLANTIDAKDKYTNGHSNRVAKYSKEIARRMNKDEDVMTSIYFMGLLHDIGKIGIRDDIITKTNKLTDEEFDVIKNHSAIGYDILKNMTEIPNIEYAARWHHERYDGKGYPDGLKGEEIPEYARIICVADAYDAMTSKRSYRSAMSQEIVRSEIENGKGKQFDPVIAQIMLDMIDEDSDYDMIEKRCD